MFFLMIAGASYLALGGVVALGLARASQRTDVVLEIQEAGLKQRAAAAALAASASPATAPSESPLPRTAPALSA